MKTDFYLQDFFRRMAKDAVLSTYAFFVGLLDTVIALAVAWDTETKNKQTLETYYKSANAIIARGGGMRYKCCGNKTKCLSIKFIWLLSQQNRDNNEYGIYWVKIWSLSNSCWKETLVSNKYQLYRWDINNKNELAEKTHVLRKWLIHRNAA